MLRTWMVAALLALLAGCAGTNTAVFTTKTSVGVDIDFTPGTVAFAYDRFEGYFAPRFADGGAPTVVGAFLTTGEGIDRTVRQIYATGSAALGAIGGTITVPSTPPALSGKAEPMFFGTTTTWGIKLAVQNAAISSFVFGYKRKEASAIPLNFESEAAKGYVYPSVLATLDGSYKAQGTAPNLTTGVTQFFATGAAADKLSQDPSVQGMFRDVAKDAVIKYRDQEHLQRLSAMNLVYCLTDLEDAKVGQVWDNADQLKVFGDPRIVADLKAQATPKGARSAYANRIRYINAASPEYTKTLSKHEEFVCKLAGKLPA